MNIILKTVGLLLIASYLGACANATDTGDYMKSIATTNQAQQAALVAYFNKKSTDNQNILKALDGSQDKTSIVLYTIMSQQQDAQILKMMQPHYAEKPTSNADIGLALSNNFLPGLVKAGAAVLITDKLVDGMTGNTSTILGAGANSVGQAGSGTVNIPSNSYNPDMSGVSPMEGFDQGYSAVPIPEVTP